MDPIATIKIHKDSTFAMLLEGQRRHCPIWYMEQNDLTLQDGRCIASMRELRVSDDPAAGSHSVKNVPRHSTALTWC